MLCPYCSREMALGVIQSRDGLWWTAAPRPVAALPLGGKERIDLTGGRGGGIFSGQKTAAFCCPACKKIIIDYSE